MAQIMKTDESSEPNTSMSIGCGKRGSHDITWRTAEK
jgi:hypothetical protein